MKKEDEYYYCKDKDYYISRESGSERWFIWENEKNFSSNGISKYDSVELKVSSSPSKKRFWRFFEYK